ncbi:MAG: T9SS type A sorting domain-containing protein [Candidatus Eisenbacteria bacterium]|nr:T9SS type A sorting domain-containing protein [Candidatus Eisenbacteria bacterium]
MCYSVYGLNRCVAASCGEPSWDAPTKHDQHQGVHMFAIQGVTGGVAGAGILRRLLLLILLTTLTLPAAAVAPRQSTVPDDLLLPEGPEAITRAMNSGDLELPAAVRRDAQARLARLWTDLGGTWSAATWNPVTLTPRLITGSGFATGLAVADGRTAERVARRFVQRTSYLWGVAPADLAVERTANGLGKWSVHFRQVVGGLPVLGSRLTVTMTESGRIYAFGGDLWPEIERAARPILSPREAVHAARHALADQALASYAPRSGDRARLLRTGILPASASTGHVVHRVQLFINDPLGSWQVDVDALTGEALQIQNALRTLDFTGRITGDVEIYGWCDGVSVDSLALMEVLIDGVGMDTTAADGTYLISYAGSDPESIKVGFTGPYVALNNTNGPNAQIADETTPGVPYDIHWDDTNSRMDERDVFVHTNGIHEFIKAVDPAWTDLDFALPANVNIQQGCNAYWDGESINFFHEEDNCANTGRLGDVIAHEYGHGVTDYMYGDNDPPSDMHEANSDVHGNYYSDNSVVGPGFYLDDCENGIRDSDNDLVWPDDLIGEGHYDGQILAGVHWDIWEDLQATLGEEAGKARAAEIWHFARLLGLPLTQPEQVAWIFIADDDNGNMDDGTPNYDVICQAAEHHGFECPEQFDAVVIHHAAKHYVPAPGDESIPIEATVYSLAGEMNPDSVMVFYRLAGETEFSTAVMTDTGVDDIWEASLPHQPVASTVEYYVFGADMDHNHLTDPRDAPATLHRSQVVTVYDAFEEASGWTAGAPGDDATQGIWELVDPNGVTMAGQFPIQPEDDVTPDPGALCWITGQYEGGYPWYTDADGRTTLTSPIYDLAEYDWAVVSYYRWFQSWGSSAGAMDIDISNDGGTTWINLEHLEGGDPDAAWTLASHNLAGLFATMDQLQFRVVMFGETNPSIDEGGLDDLVIIAGTGDASEIDPETAGVPRLDLHLASGNPAAGAARIQYALPGAGRASLRIFSVTGRVIRTLVDGVQPAGLHEITWDGRDNTGRSLASGIYFIKLRTETGQRTHRLVRVE